MPDKSPRLSVGRKGFIEKHDLWGDAERHAAKEAVKRAAAEELTTVRFAVPDQHGIIRGKTLSARLFRRHSRTGSIFPWRHGSLIPLTRLSLIPSSKAAASAWKR